MATIVNNPGTTSDAGSGMGMIVGVVLAILLGFLFFYYGLPAMRNAAAPQINVPDQVDVNVNPQGGGGNTGGGGQ